MRRATLPIDTSAQDLITISIHALHEESDWPTVIEAVRHSKISIHALHEESDPIPPRANRQPHYFNPRSP